MIPELEPTLYTTPMVNRAVPRVADNCGLAVLVLVVGCFGTPHMRGLPAIVFTIIRANTLCVYEILPRHLCATHATL